MEQDKFGKLIKEIRQKNNLTQKDLADKYHVTYQAVSKWENGKNLPDISLMREISRDFNVSMDDMIEGNLKEKKKNNKWFYLGIVSIILLIIVGIFLIVKHDNDNLHSKTISTTCDDFNIYGIISYNANKSAIYIPKIEYCGNNKNTSFDKIECSLYEKNGDITKKISSYNHVAKENVTLDEFLKNVSFHVDNYLKMCKEYNENSLYLEIKGETKDNNIFYNIPLIIEEDSCSST